MVLALGPNKTRHCIIALHRDLASHSAANRAASSTSHGPYRMRPEEYCCSSFQFFRPINDHLSQPLAPSDMSAQSNRTVVCVYGTLKYGFPNWPVMPSTAVYLGIARTSIPYPLVIDNIMHIPYMLDLPNHPAAHTVYGELYSVTFQDLAMLDQFEGLASGFYIRKQISFLITNEQCGLTTHPDPVTGNVLEVGSLVQASVYFRGSAGPAWAKDLTVQLLQTFPMLSRYTLQQAADYIRREDR